MSNLIQTSNPVAEPVSLAEAKLHCRVDSAFTADDTWFTIAIQAAREQCEAYQSRAWGQRSYQYVMDGFPCGAIKLPIVPLVSVTSVRFKDFDHVEWEIDLDGYLYDPWSQPPRIAPPNFTRWPIAGPEPSSVVVTFVAGASTITARSKMGILEHVLFSYENRGDEAKPIPDSIYRYWESDKWGCQLC